MLCPEGKEEKHSRGEKGREPSRPQAGSVLPAAQPHLQLALTKGMRMRSAQSCPAKVLPSTERGVDVDRRKEFPGIFLLENKRQGLLLVMRGLRVSTVWLWPDNM